ncbi:tripartite ATP-independent transporter DctM subunit [Breoghania corrubedonensis]|uniref:TRAP transporter large permease protein n=1 Tax=Breoghania corrubedonensis TaxID=665038 RepID=A0A2T5V4Y7_9HYPH|nr:TRAP transporter large permease subunit [Breoghania corrubedonensis]PTW58822.1 tripartite ATP-independent transporter DctM subunit [Breoghania corrubedonensis]
MDTTIIAIGLGLGMLAALATGIWVAVALFGVALAAIVLLVSVPAGTVLATTVWGASNSWDLTALPMFIWMGEILFRSRLSEDMFEGLSPWMRNLPGRLLHVNILGCGIFAAVSGSSAATTATIGKMSLPELKKRGYDERMAIGTLAGSGTLGLLIPPSIILIVYGAATEQSIARLFIAGVVPGIMLCVLFMGYVAVWSMLNSAKMPPKEEPIALWDRIRATRRLFPVLLLIVGVVGSIYAGLAAPTEAAAVGVLLALLLSWSSGTLNWNTFSLALMGATRTSCMIAFILAGAAFMTVAMGFTGIPRELATWIGSLNLTPYELLAALTIFFVVLGCFLDGISVVVLTTSVILPMIEQAGLDLIWFGIYLVIVVEMSQITPPVGFNLFVLQGMTGHNIFKVARMALPFFLLMVVAVVLVVAFPQIALWLPHNMMAH